MEPCVERDHGRAAGRDSCDLDRILDCLGARVEERGSRRAGERDDPTEPLGELDVHGVRHDREVGVDELGRLLLDRLDDARVAVAHVADTDAAGEVDERVAVDVRDRRVQSLGSEHRQVHPEGLRNGALAAHEELSGAGPGDLRADLDRPRRRHEKSLAECRRYSRAVELDDLDPDPHAQFDRWFAEAAEAGVRYPGADGVWRRPGPTRCPRCGWCSSRATTRGASSSTRTGRAARPPSSRRTHGLQRCSTGSSRIGRCASRGLSSTSRTSESLAYFRTRPRSSRISAWASPQSRALTSRAELELRVAEIERRFAGRGRAAAAAVLGRVPHRRLCDRVLAGAAEPAARPGALRAEQRPLEPRAARAVGRARTLSPRAWRSRVRARPSCRARTRSRAGIPSPLAAAPRRSAPAPAAGV